MTGILVGAASFAFIQPGLPVSLLLMMPMVADGALQAATPYESGNIRRLITGTLFGYGILCLFLLTTGYAFQFGLSLGRRWT